MASANAFPLIRAGWYVAAPSSRLRTEPLACRALDHDIVLLRDAAGAVHALADRWGAHFECGVQADTSTLLARRIIALASAGRGLGARATLPPRRVVSAKVQENAREPD